MVLLVSAVTGFIFPPNTSRTNEAAVEWLQDLFPHRHVRSFELNKSDTDPSHNALHLDCCLCPLSKGHALVAPAGFKSQDDLAWLRDHYPPDYRLELSPQEMASMQCNLLSISPDCVLSGPRFSRVNEQLRMWGYEVHEVGFFQSSKMGGLLRCSTLPLKRASANVQARSVGSLR